MNCPECGSQVQAEQQFCRECGAGLQENGRDTFVPSPILGVLLAFGGIIIALAGRMLLNETLIVFLGVVTSILGMTLVAVTPLFAARQARERGRRFAAHPVRLTPTEPTRKLPPLSARDEFGSVVESTTELLNQPPEANEFRR